MPRQNRVSPFGAVVAFPERGTLLGNRGVLHDEGGRIRRAWQVKRWILCLLAFRGRHRQVMAPGRYTELFFLDEATGLAAGHRPCFECQRARFYAFRDAWASGNPGSPGSERPNAGAIDDRLHAERVNTDRSKQTFRAILDDLPDGVLVVRDARDRDAFLRWDGHLWLWSPGGYREGLPLPKGEVVSVLTPRSTVEAIRAGLVPVVHPSARLR
jgi:hypothetical protein